MYGTDRQRDRQTHIDERIVTLFCLRRIYGIYYTGCANKTIPYRKKFCLSAMGVLLCEPNFQTLYVSIQATYPANFIEITYVVQQIQQFKF